MSSGPQTEGSARPAQRTLVLTGHDYRSRLRATLHFVIDELRLLGDVRVFTPGMSELLRVKRALPDEEAGLSYNRVVEHNSVTCFVWRTLVHPFNPRTRLLHPLSSPLFDVYRKMAPQLLGEWAAWADTIIVESGFPALFLEDLAAFNPKARLIYFASDALETIGCDPHLIKCLERAAPRISWACVLSPKMTPFVPAGIRKVVVPQGVDTMIATLAGASPFSEGQQAVSVGAMLFDARFFKVASEAFPEVTFHIIGSQAKPDPVADNVRWYPTLPFAELPAFIKHASFGIAAYKDSPGTEYLSDTSLKLIQYGMLGLPAVCPHFAVGDKRLRYGYTPGDPESILLAVRAALACTDRSPVSGTSWQQVVQRMLNPSPEGEPVPAS